MLCLVTHKYRQTVNILGVQTDRIQTVRKATSLLSWNSHRAKRHRIQETEKCLSLIHGNDVASGIALLLTKRKELAEQVWEKMGPRKEKKRKITKQENIHVVDVGLLIRWHHLSREQYNGVKQVGKGGWPTWENVAKYLKTIPIPMLSLCDNAGGVKVSDVVGVIMLEAVHATQTAEIRQKYNWHTSFPTSKPFREAHIWR